jgi:hypothetical protein
VDEAGGGPLDEIVLLDREVDPYTPMCTQLTYEGLVDESLHIRNGSVTMENPSGALQSPCDPPISRSVMSPWEAH